MNRVRISVLYGMKDDSIKNPSLRQNETKDDTIYYKYPKILVIKYFRYSKYSDLENNSTVHVIIKKKHWVIFQKPSQPLK